MAIINHYWYSKKELDWTIAQLSTLDNFYKNKIVDRQIYQYTCYKGKSSQTIPKGSRTFP